jgi:UDP-2,4-diacetamido-2,4,6-trideoxy-beta-L-altropyranose hydrolase
LKQHEIFIRADGSNQIGLGHLVRCMALAEMLKFDYDITFVCKQIPGKSADVIKELNFKLLIIDEEESFVSQLKSKQIVVLDHYELGSSYQNIIKQKGCELVCIDDLHQEHFYADAIINHAPGVKSNQYDAEAYTQFYLGLDYVLLRSEFREQANRNRKIERINNVLICFGGADTYNITYTILKTVVRSGMFKRINVIVGNSYNYISVLTRFCANHKNIQCFYDLTAGQMVEVMHESELAIVPASSIAIECHAAKQVLLTGITDENQNDIHNGLVKFNTVKTIGDFRNLDPEILFSQLKIIKEQTNEFSFSDVGDAANSIKNIFNSLSYDKN